LLNSAIRPKPFIQGLSTLIGCLTKLLNQIPVSPANSPPLSTSCIKTFNPILIYGLTTIPTPLANFATCSKNPERTITSLFAKRCRPIPSVLPPWTWPG